MSKMMTAVQSGGDYIALTDLQRTVFGKEIMFAALPVMKFFQFAVKKTELVQVAGRNVRFMKYGNLSKGGRIEHEADDIPNSPLSTSYVDITVYEHGNSVFVSELLLKSSFDDVLQSTAKLLGRDYADVLDTMLMSTALSGSNVVYGGQKASKGALTSASILDLATIKDAVEVLSSNNVPKINNDFYVCFVNPHQARGLRDDSKWQNVQQYAFMGAMVSPPILGEIGRIEDVRFIETTQMPIETGSSFDIYKAILMGDDYYAFAEGQPVELREQYNDKFGRKHGLAWYNIMGSGLLHDEFGVRIETA